MSPSIEESRHTKYGDPKRISDGRQASCGWGENWRFITCHISIILRFLDPSFSHTFAGAFLAVGAIDNYSQLAVHIINRKSSLNALLCLEPNLEPNAAHILFTEGNSCFTRFYPTIKQLKRARKNSRSLLMRWEASASGVF